MRAQPPWLWCTQAEAEFIQPRNETELTLTRIWQEVLGIEKVGIRDSFFDPGGDSLFATRIIMKIKKEAEMYVPLEAIFTYDTIEKLFRFLRAKNLLTRTVEEE